MSNHNHDCFSWTYSYYLTLYILSIHILDTNTRSSPHWVLVVEEDSGRHIISPTDSSTVPGSPASSLGGGGNGHLNGRSMAGNGGDRGGGGGGGGKSMLGTNESFYNPPKLQTERSGVGTRSGVRPEEDYFLSAEDQDELVLQILSTTILSSRGSWTKNGREVYCPTCPMDVLSENESGLDGFGDMNPTEEILDCGRPANFTYYDQLIGVANRANHPHIPEPQVALFFKKKNSKKDTVDLNALERKLRKAKKEKPSSVQLYNQIGNFWRIKGHTLRSIECFRRALAVAPNNPETLHYMARLLLTLQYLDDALFLARRSLELQTPDRSAYLQHFTLGEILKQYGNFQEAILAFKHTLELRPDHAEALQALQELETLLAPTGLHICTILIIIFLVLGVLLVMVSSLENEELESRNQPRHFSRALAMRSIKLGISPRGLRAKSRLS